MKDDPEFSELTQVAMTYYRRPIELGAGYVSENQQMFEHHIMSLCQNIIQSRGSNAKAGSLQEVLTNFAATVWLTWAYMPQGEADLTREEARVGVLSLVNAFAPESSGVGGIGSAA
jgi:hypothetical protein